MPEHGRAAEPRHLARTPVGFHHKRREHVQRHHPDEDVRRPAVDRAHEPAEGDLPRDALDALVGGRGPGLVVEEEQQARPELDQEQEEGEAPEVVEDRETVVRDDLDLGQVAERFEADALVEPGQEPRERRARLSHGPYPTSASAT